MFQKSLVRYDGATKKLWKTSAGHVGQKNIFPLKNVNMGSPMKRKIDKNSIAAQTAQELRLYRSPIYIQTVQESLVHCLKKKLGLDDV